jgi:polyhydroxyalkanoate synthesis regulator phasin
MPPDDRFKKYQVAGADFLETARVRAEELLQELSRVGDSTQRQAQDVVDDFVESSRRGSEQLFGVIRKEITAQLSAMGLATKDDLAALERRLSGRAGPAASAAAKGPASKKAAGRSAAGAKKTTAKKAGVKKAAAKKTPGKKTAAEKAAGGS